MKIFILFLLCFVLAYSDQNLSKCPEEQSFSGILSQMQSNEEKSNTIISQIAKSNVNQNVEQKLLEKGVNLQDYYQKNIKNGYELPTIIFIIPIFVIFLILLFFINFIARKIAKTN